MSARRERDNCCACDYWAVAPDPSLALVVADLVGVFVFALSGALVAVRKGLDVFGVLVLSLAAGLGGGMLRDVLIGDVPAAALEHWWYLVVPVVSGVITSVYHPALGRMEHFVTILDALGLALFVVAGAAKAMDFGISPLGATLLGLLTGIGGGIVRDVLAGRVPIVLRGDLYAIPGIAGAAVVAFGMELGSPQVVVMIIGAVVCAVWRLLALWMRWQAPLPRGAASV